MVGGADNPFAAIADALDITLGKDKAHKFLLENHRFQRNGTPLTDDQRAACVRYYIESYQAIVAAAKQDRDVALSDVIDIEHEFAPPFLGGIATAWGKDVDQVSTADAASAEGELGCGIL